MIPSHEDEAGNKLKAADPYVWNHSSAIAVEVKMSPQKSREHMVKKYRKQEQNALRLDQVRRDLRQQTAAL